MNNDDNKLILSQSYEETVIPQYSHPFLNISPVTHLTLNNDIKIEAGHKYTFREDKIDCELIISIPIVDRLTASAILNQIRSSDVIFVTMYVQRHIDLITKSMNEQLNYNESTLSNSFDILPGQNPLALAMFAATQPNL
jgi:hypothetical protein